MNLLQQVRHKKTDINPAAVLQYNLNLLKRDDKVILDRSFTETNRYRALLQLIGTNKHTPSHALSKHILEHTLTHFLTHTSCNTL